MKGGIYAKGKGALHVSWQYPVQLAVVRLLDTPERDDEAQYDDTTRRLQRGKALEFHQSW